MKSLFKKACTLVTAVTFSLCAVPFQTGNIINSVMAEDDTSLVTESGLYYEIINGEITITDCDDTLTDIVIPSEIDGIPVTTIGERAFEWKSQLHTVVISEGIKRIEYCGFAGCRFLTSIQLPQSLEYIGEAGFDCCDSLKAIEIPPKVTVINKYTFRQCGFEQLEIPETVTSIREYAFTGCWELLEISIPDSISVIEKEAFSSCNMLQYVIIPYGVTRIEESAFARCQCLKAVFLPESLSYIGKEAFDYCRALKEIELPESLSVIDDNALHDTGITQIKIPENLRYLGYNALPQNITPEVIDGVKYVDNWATGYSGDKDTKSITVREGTVGIAGSAFILSYGGEINIPSTVRYIGNKAFNSAYDDVISLNVSADSKYFCSSDGVLYSKDMTQLVYYPAGKTDETFNIHETVTEISDYAFYENENLKSVNIPDSVEYIGDYAFSLCKGLTEIILPENLNEIGEGAFQSCKGLGDNYKLDIPDSVTKIGANAFANSGMYKTYYTENNSNIDMVDDWIVCGDDFFPSQNINLNARGIADGAYKDRQITDIILPDTVQYIGDSAFKDCRLLESVTLPANLIAIDDSAFLGCIALETLSVPESVVHVGAYAFEYCENAIENIDGIKYVDNWSVGSDYNLKSAVVREGTRGLSEFALAGCTELESVELPQTLCFINDEAFEFCIALKNVNLPESLLAIDTGAFAYCTEILEITIPENTSYIDYASFVYCEKLNKITFMNPETLIYPNPETIAPNAVIYGYNNSIAKKYAELFEREFIPLDGVPEEITGDANLDGNIDVADVVAISAYVANPEINSLSEQCIINADVHDKGNGLNANDALAIQQYLANIITSLPV